MTLEEYLKTREGASNGKPLYSDSLCVTELGPDERTVTAIISTNRIDRMKEVLLPRGADIAEYLRNPVVPWGHDSRQPPIGRALWLKKQKNGLMAKVEFATTERAEEVWQLFKQGFLKAFSVGFRPLKGHPPTEKEIKKKPAWAGAEWIYDEWELLEFSPVTIPANPDALAIAIKSQEIVLSDEMRKELDVIEEDTEETFYPPEVVTEVVKAVAEEIDKEIMDGIEEEESEETTKVAPFKTEDKHVRALPLPMTVNPDPHIKPIVESARGIEDAFPLRITHNYDAEPFVEKVEAVIEVKEIYEVEPLINVTPFSTEQEKQELVAAALADFDKDVRGTMWEPE